MIITIISLIALVLGIVFFVILKIKEPDGFTETWYDNLGIAAVATSLFGVIAMSICSVLIITSHATTEINIAKAEIKYNALSKQVAVINSDYEDVSKATVIQNVAEWNMNVEKEKYWTYNPLTSWFYSQKYTESLKYIDLDLLK